MVLPTGTVQEREVRIACGHGWLYGDLALPSQYCGLVIFVQGSGVGRHNAFNRQVAYPLQQMGLATLLLDLLTAQEQNQTDLHTGEHCSDIALLTHRLQEATAWAMQQPELEQTPIGYFGADSGSAAALIAAARLNSRIACAISLNGRPDSVGPVALQSITAPTLLIACPDEATITSCREAYEHLRCPRQLKVIPVAAHLFQQRYALEQLTGLTNEWFKSWLACDMKTDRHLAKEHAL